MLNVSAFEQKTEQDDIIQFKLLFQPTVSILIYVWIFIPDLMMTIILWLVTKYIKFPLFNYIL